jgi:hypothetical protein
MTMFNYEALHQVSSPMWLVPAYGRQYKTREHALKDWQSGKDFQIEGGPYCSIRDLDLMRREYSNIYILYQNGSVAV